MQINLVERPIVLLQSAQDVGEHIGFEYEVALDHIILRLFSTEDHGDIAGNLSANLAEEIAAYLQLPKPRCRKGDGFVKRCNWIEAN